MKKYKFFEVEMYVNSTLLERIEYESMSDNLSDLIDHLFRMLNFQAYMGMRKKSDEYRVFIEQVVLSKRLELFKHLVRNSIPLDATHKDKNYPKTAFKVDKDKNGVVKCFRWSETYPIWDEVAPECFVNKLERIFKDVSY